MSRHVLQSFRRLYRLSPLMGGMSKAASYLAQARHDADCMGSGEYCGCRFHFRTRDLTALDEILVREEYAPIAHLLSIAKNPQVVDVGSNIGMFSIWALARNINAHVLAVEASPRTYQVLQLNAAHQVAAGRLLKTVCAAAWGKNGELRFRADGDSMGHRIDSSGSCVVQGLTLENLLGMVDGHRPIELMKVDIEGAEESFLCGASAEFGRINHLVVELHRKACNVDRVRKWLSQYYSGCCDLTGRVSAKPLLHYYR